MSHVVENEYMYGIGHTGKVCIATNIHNTKQTVYQCSPIHHITYSMTTILIAKNSLTNTSCKSKNVCSKVVKLQLCHENNSISELDIQRVLGTISFSIA